MAPFDGRAFVVGVRPGDITVSREQTAATLNATVVLLEPTGADLWSVGDWRGQHIKGRAAHGEQLRPGMSAGFVLPLLALHVFDEGNDRRLDYLATARWAGDAAACAIRTAAARTASV